MRSNQVTVITGGGGGMGLACARRLGGQGPVLVADIDPARVDQALALLAADGVEAHGETVDVSEPASVHALAQQARSLGDMGALVHTAGLSPSMADGRRILDVDLRGSALIMEAFSPLCTSGSVAVLIASQAGHLARAGASPEIEAILDDPLSGDLFERLESLDPAFLDSRAAYAFSKLGVIRLVTREARTWGPRGGRVVSLSPGVIDTGQARQEAAHEPFMSVIVEQSPLGRMGTPDEIAAAVAFLCSDDAAFITGCDLLIDGGSTPVILDLLKGTI